MLFNRIECEFPAVLLSRISFGYRASGDLKIEASVADKNGKLINKFGLFSAPIFCCSASALQRLTGHFCDLQFFCECPHKRGPGT
jgi:hypothetical protein